jgi:hypothetical protein
MEGRGRVWNQQRKTQRRKTVTHPPPIFALGCAEHGISLRHGKVPGSSVSSCGRLLLL